MTAVSVSHYSLSQSLNLLKQSFKSKFLGKHSHRSTILTAQVWLKCKKCCLKHSQIQFWLKLSTIPCWKVACLCPNLLSDTKANAWMYKHSKHFSVWDACASITDKIKYPQVFSVYVIKKYCIRTLMWHEKVWNLTCSYLYDSGKRELCGLWYLCCIIFHLNKTMLKSIKYHFCE